MKAWKLALGDGVSTIFGLLGPLRRHPGCRVLMYHALGAEVPGDRQAQYSMAAERFRQHMHCLAGTPGRPVLGLGDGGAHCGVLCDASLPSYMLTHWVRDRDRGERFDLEQVVAMQTSRTAALYGFDDRGVVAPGYRADLNVIDLDGLRIAPPAMVHDLPAGGRRLIQRASGYGATVVAGVPVAIDDEPTGDRPGGLLRGAQPAPP